MGQESLQILIVMVVYMAAVIGIGISFARRANADTEKFFLGGRSLGPWVSAMSAEASDMSGWLLMGLPWHTGAGWRMRSGRRRVLPWERT